MQTATRSINSMWTTVRTQLRESRDARAARASLARELASYSSPADLADLDAILDRYSRHRRPQTSAASWPLSAAAEPRGGFSGQSRSAVRAVSSARSARTR